MSPLFYAAGEVRPGLHFALQRYKKIMTYAKADVIFSDFSCLNAKTMLRKGLVRGLSDFCQTFIESPISIQPFFVVPSTSSPVAFGNRVA